MEIARRSDDLCLMTRHTFDLICPLARKFERGLNGFRPTVHRQGHFIAGHLGEFFVKQRQLVIAKCARGERDLLGLFEQRIPRFSDGRVPD